MSICGCRSEWYCQRWHSRVFGWGDISLGTRPLRRRFRNATKNSRKRPRERPRNDKLRETVLADESEIWRLHSPRPPNGYSNPINASRPKIIVIANNKGGVGKTTLTAGLAAYFERRKSKRVLLIDLDYQGSLTKWLLQAADVFVPENQTNRLALSNKLIDGSISRQWQPEVLSNDGDLKKAQLITANYALTDHETKLMLRWLKTGGDPDIRYHVAEALLSSHVQDHTHGYDVVLIDAPPRLTTGAVGALVAGTHLLVPTILDPLSAETAGSFLRQAWALRVRLNLGIELVGVVGTMTPPQPLENALGSRQQDALGIVRAGLSEWPADTYIFQKRHSRFSSDPELCWKAKSVFSECECSPDV